MSAERKDIQHCRWADQTLLLDEPYWLNAWDFPWSCHHNGEPHPVEDTRECRTCARWERRDVDADPVNVFRVKGQLAKDKNV
jgi:hypothetical protein